MEFFKRSLVNSIDCEVTVLADLLTANSWDRANLPANLRHFLCTTLVLKQKTKEGTKIRSESLLSALDENIFKGKFKELLEKYKLSPIWEEALLQTVLVADRQVTHYIQVSGYPLTEEKSTLLCIATGLKKEVFREEKTEQVSRLYDQKHIISDRKKLFPRVASDELKVFRKALLAQDQSILKDAFQRWSGKSPQEKVSDVFSSILRVGHPVRRTLDNFVSTERSQDLLRTFSAEKNTESSTWKVGDLSARFISRHVPKNLLFGSSLHRLENFVRNYMQTRIDHGSIELLESRLRNWSKQPKWIGKLHLGNYELFLKCLSALLVKLVILNIHAVFQVSSRASSPKVPEYAPKQDVVVKRSECLKNLREQNLEPSDAMPQGKMIVVPKANPFEYRPIFTYTSSKPNLSKALRSYFRCLKSDSQARLRRPICAMNSPIALQQLAEFRRKGKLYFVKGDVRDCYGSVSLESLKGSLTLNWPSTPKAWEFWEMDLPLRPRPRNGKARKRRVLHLFEDRIFKRPLCDGRLSILIPTGKLSVWDPQKELRSVINWTENIVVEIGQSKFRFRKGVPQGAILSALIADLYLALHVDQLFERFGDDLAVFRTMDDFLAVSTSSDTAQRCLNILKNESLHEGLIFSEKKFQTNWSTNHEDDGTSAMRPFRYCGEELDPVSGHFRFSPDYKPFVQNPRCYGKDLHGRSMEKAFKYLLTSSYWGHPPGLFSYDGSNLPVVLRNIFEAAVNNALRFRSYVDDTHIATPSLLKFFEVHRHVFARYVRTAVFKHSLGGLIVSRRSLLYLHLKAFKKVRGSKKSRYQSLLSEITKHFKDDGNIQKVRHRKLLYIASREI